MKPKKINELEALASNLIGDGQSPNLYFVTDRGVVVTVTRSFEVAREEWKQLSRRSPRLECALEDRKVGVLASVEPESDEEGAPLRVFDHIFSHLTTLI